MKAVNYQGAFKVKVEDVPMPAIEHPDDIIVKVTTAGTYTITIALRGNVVVKGAKEWGWGGLASITMGERE
jgi:Alcohol dehydrogenase GroES-associated